MSNSVGVSAPIDLKFRPASYFWPLGLEKHLLARVKGAQRKRALQAGSHRRRPARRDSGLSRHLGAF